MLSVVNIVFFTVLKIKTTEVVKKLFLSYNALEIIYIFSKTNL